jgi:GAF domain-containing protein
VSSLGDTIVSGMRGMVDYHNVRVYVVEEDGRTLEPIAFRGVLTEYDDETLDSLRTVFGEGITGRAAEDGRTLNVPDANACEFAVDVPGTDDIDESILAVPMRFDNRTIGMIVLSKLGLDQFSPLAVRIVELLAAQAAITLANTRLHESEQRANALSRALLDIADAAAGDLSALHIVDCAVRTARQVSSATAAVLVDTTGSGPAVVASEGDALLVEAAFAAMTPFTAAPADIRVLATDQGELAMATVHGGVLIAAGPGFTADALDAIAAFAAQATLALRNADLLARARRAG